MFIYQASARLQLAQILCSRRFKGTAFQYLKLQQYFQPSFSKIKNLSYSISTLTIVFLLLPYNGPTIPEKVAYGYKSWEKWGKNRSFQKPKGILLYCC
jgi:hypothetical protein